MVLNRYFFKLAFKKAALVFYTYLQTHNMFYIYAHCVHNDDLMVLCLFHCVGFWLVVNLSEERLY